MTGLSEHFVLFEKERTDDERIRRWPRDLGGI